MALSSLRSTSFGCFAFVAAFLANITGLLAYHNHTEADELHSGVWQRVQQGPNSLTTMDKLLFGCLVLFGFEILDFWSKHCGQWFGTKEIPVRGKHLDELSSLDLAFIGLSKAGTVPFTYFYLRYCYYASSIVWTQMTITNTILPLIPLFITFDLFYTILHWFLHIKGIYGYIHKHHHHQKAPSRANVDAVNVHPVEFVLGEYNHLLALFLTSQIMTIHIICPVLFLVIGGTLAGINHTRYDIVWSVAGVKIFDSKAHDVHHRIPQSNYGQYSMFWDSIFGTYRPYDPNDRVNPDAQLDPKTGKSFSCGKKQKGT